MKDIPMTTRIFLAVAGATSLLNTPAFLQLHQSETTPPTGLVLLTLTFCTLSFINGLLLIFAAWQLPRLLENSRGFVKFALWMRYALVLLQYVPVLIGFSSAEETTHPLMPLSLIILWTGVILYMVRSMHDLSLRDKQA